MVLTLMTSRAAAQKKSAAQTPSSVWVPACAGSRFCQWQERRFKG
jgi:hypothetical protein